MWAMIGRAAGILPVVIDLIQNSGAPSWLSGAGVGVLAATETAIRIKRKRSTPAKPFDTDEARRKVEKIR